MKAWTAAFVVLAATTTTLARADDPPTPTEPAQVDLTKDTKAATPSTEDVVAPPPEAPPPPPYKKTLVLDASGGALAFVGQFGKVAPPAPLLRVQLGYELLKWFMIFGEGELAFSDTSNKQVQPATRAFTMFGFGGGARFTVRFTDRVGAYLQGAIGAMKADIAHNALAILGFREAETLGLYLGGRLGVEWYQIDRHLGLGLHGGGRLAQGFAKTGVSKDTPAAIDGGVSLRYAF